MRWWAEVQWIRDIAAEGARRADEAEVYYLEGFSVSATLKRREVANASGSRSKGLAIRVITDGRIGASSTSDPAGWEKCLDAAVASAKIATKQPWEGLPGPQN